MALDIPAIVSGALASVWSPGGALESVLTEVVVKTGPSSAYDASTDVTTTTWASSVTADGLPYGVTDQEQEAASTEDKDAILQGRAKNLLLQAADFDVPPTTASVVEMDSFTWQVIGVVEEPSGATYILKLRR